jgi:hypothetical protein
VYYGHERKQNEEEKIANEMRSSSSCRNLGNVNLPVAPGLLQTSLDKCSVDASLLTIQRRAMKFMEFVADVPKH